MTGRSWKLRLLLGEALPRPSFSCRYDRPSTFGLLDDPFFFRSSTLPYYLRPRRLSSALDGNDNGTHTESSSETVTKMLGSNNSNAINYPNAADEKTGQAELHNQKDKFVINVDVSHFAPDEIQVSA